MARWTPDPSFYASPGQAAQAPPETLAYVATLNTGSNGDRAPDALTVLDLEPGSPTYGQLVGRLDMPGVGDELHHFGWNACSSRAVPVGAAPARRAPLPARARPALVADPRRRRQGRPARAQDRQGDRGRRDRPQGRLQPPAHDPLRPRRDLRLRARQPRGRRPGRDLPARPRRLLGQGRVGGRPRPAGAGLRLLVAPRLRHRDHQRVGHAEDGRGRPRRRAAARQQVRPQAARVGPQEAPPPAGDRPRPRAPDGARAAARARRPQGLRVRRRRHLDRRPVGRPCGCGSAPTTAR